MCAGEVARQGHGRAGQLGRRGVIRLEVADVPVAAVERDVAAARRVDDHVGDAQIADVGRFVDAALFRCADHLLLAADEAQPADALDVNLAAGLLAGARLLALCLLRRLGLLRRGLLLRRQQRRALLALHSELHALVERAGLRRGRQIGSDRDGVRRTQERGHTGREQVVGRGSPRGG